MEREVGGGIGMGNTCKSMADSCQCMTKTTTKKKFTKNKQTNTWPIQGSKIVTQQTSKYKHCGLEDNAAFKF